MNNKIIIGIVVVAVLVLGGWYLMNQDKTGENGNNTNPPPPSSGIEGGGKVIFSITDAAADMKAVTAVRMTVSKIEMESATEGWVTVSNQTQTHDLLDLKARNDWALLAETNVPADTYNQVRLMVQKVEVVMSTTTKTAKLPSGELKLVGKVVVEEDTTSSVNIDVFADKSLHTTGKGEFIFAPVVKMESRSDAEVSVANNDTVTVSGGKVDAAVNAGMDIDGTVKTNFMLDLKTDLEIQGGVIKAKGLLKL